MALAQESYTIEDDELKLREATGGAYKSSLVVRTTPAASLRIYPLRWEGLGCQL